MGFKKYNSLAAYEADTIAPDERRVSIIDDGVNDPVVKYDNPNIHRDLPEVGDALFINNTDGNKLFVKDATGTPSGYTLVGFVFKVNGNKVKILEKTEGNNAWLACWQYAITAIAQTNIRIGLRVPSNYNVETTFNITLPSTQINSAAVSAINTVLSNTIYWAYLAKSDGTLTTNDAEGVKIIIQCDSCNNYQQYNVTGTNCTIALCVWDDMSANNVILRNSGISSNWGIMNLSKSVTYFSTGGITPTSNVAINSTSIVKRACFEDSTNAAYGYCAALRAEYETYENYVKANKVKYPQYYGAFTLPNGLEMTSLYGNVTAPTKTGGTIYKFPALHYGATINYDSEGLTAGNWHLSGIEDGMEFMEDNTISVIATMQRNLNVTTINTNYIRWFACRANASYAWFFDSQNGQLTFGSGGASVGVSRACRTVTEITI